MSDALETVLIPGNKGLGPVEREMHASEAVARRWNLLAEDLSLPAAVLMQDRMLRNLAWMQRFIAAYGVKLAPHGKTTMAPKLFALQMQAGAWGITLATAQQTRVAHQHGIRRVLMANQLVGKQNMQNISELLADPEFEYFCLVDSAAQVDQLGEFFRARGQRLQVLIELGAAGGRTGVRDSLQLQSLLASLERWRDCLEPCGVEIYEGVLEEETAIRGLLERAVLVARGLAQSNTIRRRPVLLSGAGSSWYDVVAEVFSQADLGAPAEVVLRPGCYLTHDVGVYQEAQQRILQRNPVARSLQSGLLPALQLWAYVQSVPEEEKAILTLGKRDAAFDAGLPVPALRFRPGFEAPVAAPRHWKVSRMMDQHAYLSIARGDDIRVGDMIGLDISHPCLTFDKWRFLPILDASYYVVDVAQTFF